MGSESGTYEYTSLPTATSIRLLEILGEDEDGLLQCNLEIVDLIDLPIYNCLSYTWGNPYPEGVYSGTEGPDYGESNTWPISCGGDLHLVSQNLYDALQMLRQNRVTIAEQPDSRQRTRLHLAAESGDLDIVSHLLHNGADSASQDIDEQTPMDRAIENDHHHAVRMMIQSECDKANVDTSNGVPKTSKEIRHDRLLKSTNRYVQSLQVHGEPAKSSGRPGIERSFIWIDALCIYSHRPTMKYLGTLRFQPQFFEGFHSSELDILKLSGRVCFDSILSIYSSFRLRALLDSPLASFIVIIIITIIIILHIPSSSLQRISHHRSHPLLLLG
jgi:hypothetical protein